MSPYIYQLIMRGEIKLPVLLEDVEGRGAEVPPIHTLYQPLRQAVYAVMFNLNHQRFGKKQVEEGVKANRRKADDFRREAKKCKKEEDKKDLVAKADAFLKTANETKVPDVPDVRIREWLPYNNYDVPDVIEAKEVSWSVPTLQRLWFGSTIEDKQKRLRAFLTCMKCDDCPLLLTQNSVPQHMLIIACVLRYIMTSTSNSPNGTGIALRKPELDALLATAFSPELRNPRVMAEMKLDMVTRRGVQLSTMVMQVIPMVAWLIERGNVDINIDCVLLLGYRDGNLCQRRLRRPPPLPNVSTVDVLRRETVPRQAEKGRLGEEPHGAVRRQNGGRLCDREDEGGHSARTHSAIYRYKRAFVITLNCVFLWGLFLFPAPIPVGMPAAFNAAVAAATNPTANRVRIGAPVRFSPPHQHHHPGHLVPPHPHPAMLARGGQLVVGGAIVGQWNANFGGPRHRGLTPNHNQLKKKKKKVPLNEQSKRDSM
jgi:hypothetical protein